VLLTMPSGLWRFKHRFLVVVFCLSALAAAQTKAPPKSKALLKCESALSDATTRGNTFFYQSTDLNAQLEKSEAANKELATKNAEFQKQYTQTLAVLSIVNSEFHGQTLNETQVKTLKAIPPTDDAITLGSEAEAAFKKLGEHDSQMVDKYNSLLTDYKDYVQRVGIQLAQIDQGYARQQRFNNALALYNAMPKYTPPPLQVFQPVVQPRLQTNCTTQYIGTTAYTDCN
jgi:hypothetical protein